MLAGMDPGDQPDAAADTRQAVWVWVGRALMRLLAAALVLALADTLLAVRHEPRAVLLLPQLLAPHALLVVPLAVLGGALAHRFGERLAAWMRPSARHLRWGLAGVGLVVAWSAMAWTLGGERMVLGLELAVVTGSLAALVMLACGALVLGRRPPRWVWAVTLGWLLLLLAGPLRRAAPHLAPWAALLAWLLAAGLPVWRERWLAGLAAGLALVGLVAYGPAGASALHRHSVLGAPLVQVVHLLSDVDRDGASNLLGGGDCEPFDPEIGPTRVEVVANRVDDNCSGGELSTTVVPPDRPEAAPPTPGPNAPDVLLVTFESWSPGAPAPEAMPFVRGLASHGIHPQVAYTVSPQRDDALVGLLTSAPPIDHHHGDVLHGYEDSLAEVLSRAGYRAVALHCTPELPADLLLGFTLADNRLGHMCNAGAGQAAGALAELAVQHLRRAPEEPPLLLWVHLAVGVGVERSDPPAGLPLADRALARILEGAERDTLVAVASTHGAPADGVPPGRCPRRLGPDLLRIRLLVAGSGVRPARPAWPTSLLDVAPTLTELVGVPPAPGWHGRSLLHPPGVRPVVFQARCGRRLEMRGMRLGTLLVTHDRAQGAFEVFDLAVDPEQRYDLVGTEIELFEELRDALGMTFDRLHNSARMARKRRRGPPSWLTLPQTLRGPVLPGQAAAPALR